MMAVLVFVLGAMVGSFLNVVIFRTISGDSPLRGRSYCDHCKKQLAWWMNVPLLSFLFLRGRCFYCRKAISWQYPLVEFMTGILFVWWFYVGKGFFLLIGQPYYLLQPAFWLIVGLILLLIFVFDVLYYIIPDFLTLGLFALVLFYRLWLYWGGAMQGKDLATSLQAGGALMAFFLGLYLITKKKGFGFGDVKLAPSLGLILGQQRLLVAVFLAFVLGAAVGVALLMTGKKRFGQVLPFGPFLVLGTLLSLLFGSAIFDWYFGMLL